jgi:hypothetical protein
MVSICSIEINNSSLRDVSLKTAESTIQDLVSFRPIVQERKKGDRQEGMAPFRPPFFLKLQPWSKAGVAKREHLFTVWLDSR